MLRKNPTDFFPLEMETQNLLWKMSEHVVTHDKIKKNYFTYLSCINRQAKLTLFLKVQKTEKISFASIKEVS